MSGYEGQTEEEKKPNLITTRITQIHRWWWDEDTSEFRPRYRVEVSRRANMSGRSWTESEYTYTRLGALRKARKMLKAKTKQPFQYKTIYEKKVKD